MLKRTLLPVTHHDLLAVPLVTGKASIGAPRLTEHCRCRHCAGTGIEPPEIDIAALVPLMVASFGDRLFTSRELVDHASIVGGRLQAVLAGIPSQRLGLALQAATGRMIDGYQLAQIGRERPGGVLADIRAAGLRQSGLQHGRRRHRGARIENLFKGFFDMAERLGDYTDKIAAQQRFRPLFRSIVAYGRDQSQDGAAAVARELWPGDRETLAVIERGGVAPTDTTAGASFGRTNVAQLVRLMGPKSASGALFAASMGLNFDTAASILVPGMLQSASGVGFIAQGAPVPIKQMIFDGPELAPQKIGLGFALSRELFISSNAEIMVRTVLAENISLAIDTLLLDATAGDTTRPAGLRNGIAAIGATAGGGNEALIKDIAALAAAVAPVAGSLSNIILVCNPVQAVTLVLRTLNSPFTVLTSGAVADKTVLAIAVNALAVAADGMPKISTTKEATIHMEQTSPLQISSEGAPNTVAAPLRSLFQTDCIAIRLTQELTWALRATGAIAWTQNVTW